MRHSSFVFVSFRVWLRPNWFQQPIWISPTGWRWSVSTRLPEAERAGSALSPLCCTLLSGAFSDESLGFLRISCYLLLLLNWCFFVFFWLFHNVSYCFLYHEFFSELNCRLLLSSSPRPRKAWTSGSINCSTSATRNVFVPSTPRSARRGFRAIESGSALT